MDMERMWLEGEGEVNVCEVGIRIECEDGTC